MRRAAHAPAVSTGRGCLVSVGVEPLRAPCWFRAAQPGHVLRRGHRCPPQFVRPPLDPGLDPLAKGPAPVWGRLDARVRPATAAVELVHAFSLLHDDVIDHDELCRRRPTV
ncbi:hypothetical protein FNH08_22080 [Streptomyces spongiae]|uniref:Polyprenyl synthetase family protein n=1 Tax=Streptomyces spongiae TaxID=565072 RepID=A0A5N8XKG4_9ACTN|nr:hypothetical protein [Streptomyces spongiae]